MNRVILSIILRRGDWGQVGGEIFGERTRWPSAAIAVAHQGEGNENGTRDAAKIVESIGSGNQFAQTQNHHQRMQVRETVQLKQAEHLSELLR